MTESAIEAAANAMLALERENARPSHLDYARVALDAASMMKDDPEKIANAALHQRAALMAEIQQLTEALLDIRELVDDYADVDDGQPNLAMKIQVVVETVLSRK